MRHPQQCRNRYLMCTPEHSIGYHLCLAERMQAVRPRLVARPLDKTMMYKKVRKGPQTCLALSHRAHHFDTVVSRSASLTAKVEDLVVRGAGLALGLNLGLDQRVASQTPQAPHSYGHRCRN